MKPRQIFRLPSAFTRGSKSNLTLLFLTPNRLIRADFAGLQASPVLDQIFEAGAPPASEGIPVLADAAFALGPDTRRSIFILSTTVLTQNVILPKAKAAALKGPELLNALHFEAEALTGINPFDSALGTVLECQDAQDSTLRIGQMSAADLSTVRHGFARRRSELRGVLHPAGLPRSLGASAPLSPNVSWRRIELWPEQVVCVAGHGDSVCTHLIATAPGRPGWQGEADEWFAARKVDAEPQCLAPDSYLLAQGIGSPLSLSEDANLKAWLTCWAGVLASGAPPVAVIHPPRMPMPDRRRYTLAAAAASVVAGICFLHDLSMRNRERRLNAELASLQLPINHLAALRARGDQLQTEGTRKGSELSEFRDLQSTWSETIQREHRRHAAFLSALAEAAPPDLAVTGISEQTGSVEINALSMSPEVPQFVTHLASRMNPLGWHLEPPSRKALGLQEDGGPWALKFQLKPAVSQAVQRIPDGVELPVLVPVPLHTGGETNQLARANP